MKTTYTQNPLTVETKTTFSGGKTKTFYCKPVSAVAARSSAHGAAEIGQGGN